MVSTVNSKHHLIVRTIIEPNVDIDTEILKNKMILRSYWYCKIQTYIVFKIDIAYLKKMVLITITMHFLLLLKIVRSPTWTGPGAKLSYRSVILGKVRLFAGSVWPRPQGPGWSLVRSGAFWKHFPWSKYAQNMLYVKIWANLLFLFLT